MRERKNKVLAIDFVQMRLQQLMHKCLLPESSEFYFEFFSKNKSLAFILNLGIDRDPDFSGPTKAIVFLDKENNFRVDYLSIENPNKKRSEILAKDTTNLDFYFFEPSEKKWLKNKLSEQNTLPIMMKIVLKKQKQEIDFAYIFSQSETLKIKT